MKPREPQPNISDFQALAKKARKELRTDPRQAAEKAYLASVHAARQIIACTNENPGSTAAYRSAAAIGRAAQILGGQLPADPRIRTITRAFGRALGAHSSCFYEGVCDRGDITEIVKLVGRAAKEL